MNVIENSSTFIVSFSFINPFPPIVSYLNVQWNFRSQFKKVSSKNYLWASRLLVGRRKEPIIIRLWPEKTMKKRICEVKGWIFTRCHWQKNTIYSQILRREFLTLSSFMLFQPRLPQIKKKNSLIMLWTIRSTKKFFSQNLPYIWGASAFGQCSGSDKERGWKRPGVRKERSSSLEL